MKSIKEILESDKKLKEKVGCIAEVLSGNPQMVSVLLKCFDTGSVSDKGNCMEALQLAVKEKPAFASNCLDFAIANVNHKAPRVKWEASRIIGDAASTFPEKAAKAIPALLENTADGGTVVRWSTAFALTEIAKSNPGSRKKLVPLFEQLVETESNNGVKKIYTKALSKLQK